MKGNLGKLIIQELNIVEYEVWSCDWSVLLH